MERDPIRICELLVGLPEVSVLGVIDERGEPLFVVIETRGAVPVCGGCERRADLTRVWRGVGVLGLLGVFDVLIPLGFWGSGRVSAPGM